MKHLLLIAPFLLAAIQALPARADDAEQGQLTIVPCGPSGRGVCALGNGTPTQLWVLDDDKCIHPLVRDGDGVATLPGSICDLSKIQHGAPPHVKPGIPVKPEGNAANPGRLRA